MKPRTKGARSVALLGPQHQEPNLKDVVAAIRGKGPYVLVAAGWEEREAETSALEEHLGAKVTNLGLWPACETAFERDPKLRDLMFSRYDRMQDLARIYRVRLSAELGALRALIAEAARLGDDDDLVAESLAPAFEALQDLDDHHASRVAALNDRVFAEAAESAEVQRVRDQVRATLDGAGTFLVAGGHVGILYNRMRLFGVCEALPAACPVVGWSAGAMVLTERIVLFHDSPPQGEGDAEVHGPGFGIAPGVVPLPHASTRLRLDDPTRVSLLARRFSPDPCFALDDGEWVVSEAGGPWTVGAGERRARRLEETGAVEPRKVAEVTP